MGDIATREIGRAWKPGGAAGRPNEIAQTGSPEMTAPMHGVAGSAPIQEIAEKVRCALACLTDRLRWPWHSHPREPGGLDSRCERGRTRSNNKNAILCALTGPSPHLQPETNTTRTLDVNRRATRATQARAAPDGVHVSQPAPKNAPKAIQKACNKPSECLGSHGARPPRALLVTKRYKNVIKRRDSVIFSRHFRVRVDLPKKSPTWDLA